MDESSAIQAEDPAGDRPAGPTTLAVVHRAAPDAVNAVLSRFHAEGIEAVAVDSPGILTLLVAFGSYRIRIAVPEGEVEAAQRVLAEWDREAAPNVQAIVRQMRVQFTVATVLALAVGAALFVWGWGREQTIRLAVMVVLVWFGTLVGFGVVNRVRARPKPRGGDGA